MVVAKGEASEKLLHEGPDSVRIDFAITAVKVLFQILVAVFKDQGELVLAV